MEIQYTSAAKTFVETMERWFHEDDVAAVVLAAALNKNRSIKMEDEQLPSAVKITRTALRAAFEELTPVSDREPDPDTDADDDLGECGCVLPEQSCRRCRAAAREAAGGDDVIPF